jgi:hypothetical protein
MALNQRQIKHLQTRIEEIYTDKVTAYFTVKEKEAKELYQNSILTNVEIISAIKQYPDLVLNADKGKPVVDLEAVRNVLFKPYVKSPDSFVVGNAWFKLTEHPENKLKEFKHRKNKILDEMYLGDSEEALSILRDFENTEF